MNGHVGGRMNRRRFLRAAGCAAGTLVLGTRALARHLLLVAVGETPPISQIEWILYDTALPDFGNEPLRRCALRLTTTSGAQGWSDFEGWTAPNNQTAQLIRNALIGRDPASHDSVWRQLYEEGVSPSTLGAVDVALWDLRGRIQGQPVHALLGTKRWKAKSYVSTGFNLEEPTSYAEYASACKARGVHGVKVQPHIERATPDALPEAGSPDRDMAAYTAVREAVGPDFTCVADGGGAYSYDQALRVGRLLDDLGYAWYESPMPETNEWLDRYTALASELRTPVCAPEAEPDSYESRVAWIEKQACDIARIDVHHGGFTACVQLASACESKGIPLELHNVGSDAYSHLQLIGATDETLIKHVEMLSLAQEASPLPGRITPEPTFDGQGYVAVPETPGMGLELNWKYIFTHRVG
jgi:L-alanine-DL-glutamate epimerase-like enolase superfamily enzyme